MINPAGAQLGLTIAFSEYFWIRVFENTAISRGRLQLNLATATAPTSASCAFGLSETEFGRPSRVAVTPVAA